MTKENTYPELIDHIGWKLWRATQNWKRRFEEEMVKRGFDWFAGARGSLFQHIGPNGIAQIDLARRAKMTKQAVQQHLDDLKRDGVIERVPDPRDARRNRIRLTGYGIQAAHEANRVKLDIEAEYVAVIGEQQFRELHLLLDKVADQQVEDDG